MGNQWQQDVFDLRAGGFSEAEIAQEAERRRQDLVDGGFTQNDVNDYFGIKTPDMGPVKQLIEENTRKYAAENASADGQPKQVESWKEALEAGFQLSSTDMLIKAANGESVKPTKILPQDPSTLYRILSQVGTLAGDAPEMLVGAVLGGVGGATATLPVAAPLAASGAGLPAAVGVAGAGATVGAGAGAFALPEAIRSVLMNYYEKGEIHDFKDFWERASAVFLDTSKAGLTGAATSLAGGATKVALVGKEVLPIMSKMAVGGAEVATMATVGKALEGHVPSAQDFIDAALLVGAFHGVTNLPGKLREIYVKTGIRPEEVVAEAQRNPGLKHDLLGDGINIPEEYQNLSANEKIASQIGETVKSEPGKYTLKDFYKDYVDKFDPIAKATESLKTGDLTVDKDPYKLARMASDAPAKVKHFFEKGTLNFSDLKENGKSFNEIVEPHKNDMAGLRDYIVSKRALELENRGIKSGFDVAAAKEVVANGGKYEKAANELVAFQNNIVKYLKDSGYISKDLFNAMVEAGQSYVPFKRIFEGETGSDSAKNPIKKIKGSDAKIQDPFQSMVENADFLLNLAEKNRAKKAFIELASQKENQKVIEKVPASLKPIEVKRSEITRAMEDQGIITTESSYKRDLKQKLPNITDKQIQEAWKAEQNKFQGMIDAFTVFRKADRPLAPDEFDVYRNGQREIYRATDPNLAEALKQLDGNPASQNLVMKMFRGITTVKRLGISLTPDFILRNVTRDQFTSGVFSKTGRLPFSDIIAAMGDIVGKREPYWDWLKAGGANGAFIETDKIGGNIYKLDAESSGSILSQVRNVIKKPFDALEMMGQLAEQSTRLAEAKRVMAEAKSGSKVFEAGYASRESTIDFQRIGAKVSAANQIIAFMNAGIQGLDRTGRAIKEDPQGIATKAGLLITTPSILLWYANKDDHRVQELPQWERDTHWIIATDKWTPESSPNEAALYPDYLVRTGADGRKEINKGTLWRIPKPQELGILFGTVPERVLDAYFKQNPEAFKDFEKTMQGVLLPNLIPDAISPVAEQYFNKSLFTDNKIVPGHLEGLLPDLQYTNYTTDAARALGRMVPSWGPKSNPLDSPMVIENYVRSWSGTTGMYALQMADFFMQKAGLSEEKVKPESTLADIPFLKAFVARFPTAQAESIRRFQEHYEDNKRVLDSFKALGKRGDVNDAQNLYRNEQYQRNFMDLSGVHEALSNQGQYIQKVYGMPGISAVEKRQIIESTYYGMIETARMGLQMVHDFEKQIAEDKKNRGIK